MTTITWRGRAEKVRVIGNFKGGTEGEDLEKLPDDDLWSWRDNLEPGVYKYFFEVDGEFEMDEEGENIKCHKLQVEESTDVVYMGCSHIFVHRKDLPVTRNPTDNQLCPSCSLAASFHHHRGSAYPGQAAEAERAGTRGVGARTARSWQE